MASMTSCAGCTLSAGLVTAMFVVGRVIAWWANRARMRAMARVEQSLDTPSAP